MVNIYTKRSSTKKQQSVSPITITFLKCALIIQKQFSDFWYANFAFSFLSIRLLIVAVFIIQNILSDFNSFGAFVLIIQN